MPALPQRSGNAKRVGAEVDETVALLALTAIINP